MTVPFRSRSKEFGVDPGEGMSVVGSRILELRKEKSRDAARSRRGKENYEFYELAKLLPLPAAITSQLDKASIIRLSISYLKLREFSGHGDPPWNRDLIINNKSLKGPGRRRNSMSVAMDIFDSNQGTHILQSVDGFAFILANDGRFLYISETVSVYLGLSQVEMTGSSIFDYVHTQDHQELVDQLGLGLIHSSSCGIPSPGSQSDGGSSPPTVTPMTSERTSYMIPNPEKGLERSFCLRMKSTLTKRGVHVRTSGYRVVYVLGHLRPQMCVGLNRKSPTHLLGMVGMAIALPPPTITELRIESDTFIMRLNPDFSITYCDPLISELTDWTCEEMIGRMLYDICHAGDLFRFRKTHQDLLTKGQVLSDYYRMMNRNGGYIWVQMCATTLYSSKTSDVHTVLAIIYVLSGVEFSGCVMDRNQFPQGEKMESDHSDHSEQGPDIGDKEEINKILHSPEDDQDNCSLPSNSSQHPNDKKKENMETKKQNPECNISNTDLENISDIDLCEKSHVDHPGHCKDDAAEVIVSNLEAKIKAMKSDYKNTRRKTDRPRKRRRENNSENIDNDHIMTNQWCAKVNIAKDDLSERLHNGGLNCDRNIVSGGLHGDNSNSSSPSNLNESCRHSIPLPEDLSLRSINVGPVSIGRSISHSVSLSQQQSSCWHSPSNNINHDNGTTLSSVKDIEDAMCKHLSSVQNQQSPGIISKPLSSISEPNSRYTGLPNSSQKSRSAIQWTGSNRGGGGEALPASNLLRTLYANRESVIRSSSRQQCYSNDKTSINMLTPPGTDGLKDGLSLNIPQINVNDKETVLLPYDSNDHLCSVSAANPLSDSFNMTPPSSVSPDEKATSPFSVERSFDPSSVISCSLPMTTSATNSAKAQEFSLSLTSPTSEFDNGKSTGCHLNTAPYQITDYSQYLHNSNSVIYDTRPDPWYSSVSFSS